MTGHLALALQSNWSVVHGTNRSHAIGGDGWAAEVCNLGFGPPLVGTGRCEFDNLKDLQGEGAKHCEHFCVISAGNSAGQAAANLARHARWLTVRWHGVLREVISHRDPYRPIAKSGEAHDLQRGKLLMSSTSVGSPRRNECSDPSIGRADAAGRCSW